MSYRKQLLFSTSSYQPLKAAMMKSGRFESGQIARSIDSDGKPSREDVPFPDGERYHSLMQDVDVEDRDVILLGGTIDDRETMELFDIGNMLVDNAVARLKIVIPYFGCSTQERAVFRGEAVKAKYRARLISAIPRAAFGNRVYLLDLHSEGIPHYFEGGLTAKHIYAKPLVITAAHELAALCRASGIATVEANASKTNGKPNDILAKLKVRVETCMSPDVDKALAEARKRLEVPLDQFCLASTDTGRAKWVESLTRDMVAHGLPVHPAFIIKRRSGGSVTEVLDISADVEGKIVIIYDDMIRTGGSLIRAAEAYRQKGAVAVSAISTHGIFPGDALKRLEDSGKFLKLVVTDSHPRVLELKSDFLQVVSCSELLTDILVPGKKATRTKVASSKAK